MAMDFFTIMVVLSIIGGIVLIWKLFFSDKFKAGEKIIVNYTEKVGDILVDSTSQYIGFIEEKKDLMTIPKLNIKRPVPPRQAMFQTKGDKKAGTKKIYLIKIDNNRYAFRVPTLKNQVFVYDRDEKGNIIKDNQENAKLTKHKWLLCDDVIEPDVQHWEENIQEKIREKHKLRSNLMDKWLAPISMAMIFIFAVVMFTQGTKEVRLDKQLIMEKASQMEEEAQRTQRNLNNLLESISGTKILDDEEQKREKYLNDTQQ